MTPRLLVSTMLVAFALLAGAGPAHASTFAPPDTPGPPLSVPDAKILAALKCSAGVDHSIRPPVLLIPGTGGTAQDNWSWTYEPALSKLNIPWCAVDLPYHATQDLQISAEYVVYAIRWMHSRAGERISIIGHSQGGMLGRWALRFWPDTRLMVDDVIGFAPTNHGAPQPGCDKGDAGPCEPAAWQQSYTSNFIAALNSYAETWAGISYTSIYTRLDEVATPNQDAKTGTSSLRTGKGWRANIAVQDICPNDTSEHMLIGLTDPVAYALAIDALDHVGPADPARIPKTVCAETVHPGMDPDWPAAAAAAALDFETYNGATVSSEPKLACYVTATCGCHGTVVTARFPLLRRAKAYLNGHRITIHVRHDRLVVRLDLRSRDATRVTLKVTGLRPASGRRVTYTRRIVPCHAAT